MESKGALRKLNFILARGIPFNLPHRFKIEELAPGKAVVSAPFIRKNKNHLKGIHAMCIGTCTEYCSGLVMLSSLDARKYRLIMERVEIDYHYQAKMAIAARFEVSSERLENEIIVPLKTQDRVSFVCEVKVHDTANNHISTGRVKWQIKAWDSVKTKV